MDRHIRQTVLAEVGVAGQERISRAFVEVCLDGAAGDVAVRYLAGAGVAGVRVRDAALAQGGREIARGLLVEVDPSLAVDIGTDVFGLRDPACRELARGARSALRILRAEIDATSSPFGQDAR